MTQTENIVKKLRKTLRLHFNWFIYRIAGDEALSVEELKELSSFKKLPKDSFNFTKKSFFLGRLSAILLKKEYGSLTLPELEKAMDESSLTAVEKLALSEAQRSVGRNLKTILNAVETNVLYQAAESDKTIVNAATLGSLKDQVSLAVLQKNTWKELANKLETIFSSLPKDKIETIARTELHAVKQRGVTQAIANKIDIFESSNGTDSDVSVVTHVGRCEDCASLYENKDGSPKVFKLSELLSNGSNADRSHKRVNGLHGHWVPVVPPTHPRCFCELRYIPPGYTWIGRKLVLTDRAKLTKAIGDSKLSAVNKPSGPPPSGPTPPPKVGNVPGQAAPGQAAPKGPVGPSASSDAKTVGPKPKASSGPDTSNATWVKKEDIPEGAQVVKETEHGAYIMPGGGSGSSEEEVDHVQASKEWGKQNHSSDEVIKALRTAKIVNIESMPGADQGGGLTESYRVSLENGPRALLKPNAFHNDNDWAMGKMRGDGASSVPRNTYAKREAAAMHGYNMLGLTDFVPPTITKEHNGSEHSMQAWQESYDSIHNSLEKGAVGHAIISKYGVEAVKKMTPNNTDLLFKAVPDDKKEAFMEKFQAGVVAGIVFNHNDQHLGNVLVDTDSWDVKFIDNSMSFGNGMEGCKSEAHVNMHNAGMKLKVPESLMTKMKNTTLGDVKRSLGGHIEDWAVGQTFLRMQYIMHLQETEGHLDFEKFRSTSGTGHSEQAAKVIGGELEPRKGMWGPYKEPAQAEKIQKEFERRKEAGLLQHQLFNSFAKQWINDSMNLDKDHPNRIAAEELDYIGVFMGDGFMMYGTGPEEYRRDQAHRSFEKTIKPGYPPKDITKASGLAEGNSIPTTRNSPLVGARAKNTFGEVTELSSSDLEDVTEDSKFNPSIQLSDDVKTAKPSKRITTDDIKTAKPIRRPTDDLKTKKSMRLYISLDGQGGR